MQPNANNQRYDSLDFTVNGSFKLSHLQSYKKKVFVPGDLGNILKGKWVRVVPVTGNNTAPCSVIYISINKKLKCTCFISTLL